MTISRCSIGGVTLTAGMSLFVAGFVLAGDKADAERGWEILRSRTFSPPLATARAYENAWKQWAIAEQPVEYASAFAKRYGLHEARYDNQRLPMGLRRAVGILGSGITTDCMLCHAGRVAGQTYVGLGNASIDFQSLIDDLFASDGLATRGLPTFSNVRGTIEAGAAVMYLMQFRDEDLNLRLPAKFGYPTHQCEDVPAWWNLKKKRTMYHTGVVSSRSVRSLMTFMLSPLNSGDYIKKQESAFADIQAYLLSLEPPKYPFAVDDKLAARGEQLFAQNCKRCHGTYGPDGVYPSKVVPLDVIGTDPTLATGEGYSVDAVRQFTKSWFFQETGADGESVLRLPDQPGYQAPPLDGVWATAPYLHNGSVPTVYHMLNSTARPKIYTRSYGTEREDYDPVKLGWKITLLDDSPDPGLPAIERRKIYDTTQPGRNNGGHTFGDDLTEAERMAVIEYLKTL